MFSDFLCQSSQRSTFSYLSCCLAPPLPSDSASLLTPFLPHHLSPSVSHQPSLPHPSLPKSSLQTLSAPPPQSAIEVGVFNRILHTIRGCRICEGLSPPPPPPSPPSLSSPLLSPPPSPPPLAFCPILSPFFPISLPPSPAVQEDRNNE